MQAPPQICVRQADVTQDVGMLGALASRSHRSVWDLWDPKAQELRLAANLTPKLKLKA